MNSIANLKEEMEKYLKWRIFAGIMGGEQRSATIWISLSNSGIGTMSFDVFLNISCFDSMNVASPQLDPETVLLELTSLEIVSKHSTDQGTLKESKTGLIFQADEVRFITNS